MDVGSFNTLAKDEFSFAEFIPQQSEQNPSEAPVSEQVLDSAMDDMGEKELRASGMAIALTWIEDEDHSAEELDAIITGMASDDEDGESSDIDDDFYEGLRSATADALKHLGGSEAQITSAMEGDDDAAESLAEHLSEKMESNEQSDSDLIGKFAVGASLIADSARRRVVRNGEVKIKPRRLKKRRLNSAQRGALKKARRKAHNSTARRSRRKSMKVRKQRGL